MGEMHAVRARHFAIYLALAEQSRRSGFDGRQIALWGEQVTVEMDNLRRAAAWAGEQQTTVKKPTAGGAALALLAYSGGPTRRPSMA